MSKTKSAGPTDKVADFRLGEFDGHGITRARFAGRWIEVEHGIPGEVVRARVAGEKRRYGQILEMLEPSHDRVPAPCQYFRDWHCGGCQWQHIAYESQIDRKRASLERAMKAEGIDLRVTAVHQLDEPWRYRSTAGISLGKSAGFRRHASLAIVPIHDCPISHPLIGRLMARLNEFLATGSLPDFRGRVRIEVRVAGAELDRLLTLIRPDFDRPPAQTELEQLIAALKTVDFVNGIALLSEDDSLEVVSGPLYAPVPILGQPVLLTAASFFQTNLKLLPVLIKRLLQAALPLNGKRVADVYGGVGVLGLFMAPEAGSVTLIEREREATAAARATTELWGLENVSFVSAAAEEAVQSLGAQDVVIVDPPRTGLSDQVIDALLGQLPPQLLYVSCLPSSLARDLRVLTDSGYRVEELELFDFYPQTYHVESLAILRSE